MKDKNINTLSLHELKLLWDKLFARISEATENEIALDDFDMYWAVGAPECYTMNEEPGLVVGSLKDDIMELKRLLTDSDIPVAYLNLDRFAAVLNAISQKLNPI